MEELQLTGREALQRSLMDRPHHPVSLPFTFSVGGASWAWPTRLLNHAPGSDGGVVPGQHWETKHPPLLDHTEIAEAVPSHQSSLSFDFLLTWCIFNPVSVAECV